MKQSNKSAGEKAAQRNYSNLEAQYGEVGISAVAAAMRYQNDQTDRENAPTRYFPSDHD